MPLQMLGTSPQMGFAQRAMGKSMCAAGKWGVLPPKGCEIYLLSMVRFLFCLIKTADL